MKFEITLNNLSMKVEMETQNVEALRIIINFIESLIGDYGLVKEPE